MNTCVFLKASFPTGFPHIRKLIKTRKIFKGLSCNFLHGKLHAVQFSRYKARPLLSAADLYFSTPFRFCQGFLFPSPEGLTLFKSAPQALLPVLWMGGCLAVPLGSSSTSLPHPPAFVKTFFLPADFFFDRAAGVCCQGARLFGNSFVIISSFFCKVKAFFQILGLFFFKKMCYNMIVVRKDSQMVYACSSVDRAPASGAGCGGSIPLRRTSPPLAAGFFVSCRDSPPSSLEIPVSFLSL